MKKYIFGFLTILTVAYILQSCTHDPIMIDEFEPDPKDTMTIDTTIVGNPCDPEIVYFDRDIQPILMGSCAFSGCHNTATATKDVILDSYENVISTAKVKPFDLEGSDLYEVITDSDPDKVMPPSGKIQNQKVNLIALWILQGAENLVCDEPVNCVSEDISYNDYVKEILNISCIGCHSTAAASGGVVLDSYQEVKKVADAGRLYGSINRDQGYSEMPKNQEQLDSCIISKIKSWIDEGAKNN